MNCLFCNSVLIDDPVTMKCINCPMKITYYFDYCNPNMPLLSASFQIIIKNNKYEIYFEFQDENYPNGYTAINLIHNQKPPTKAKFTDEILFFPNIININPTNVKEKLTTYLTFL